MPMAGSSEFSIFLCLDGKAQKIPHSLRKSGYHNDNRFSVLESCVQGIFRPMLCFTTPSSEIMDYLS